MLSRPQNHKVSKETGVPETLQTSTLDSIKKHFPKSFTWGRHSGNEKRDVRKRPSVRESIRSPDWNIGIRLTKCEDQQEPSSAMSRNKDKRRHLAEEWLGPPNMSDDDSQGLHINGVGQGNGGENTKKQQNHRSGQVAREPQSSYTLQPYTSTVVETTKAMAVVQRHFENLSELYIKHIEDIESVTEVHRKSIKLQKECDDKDDRIRQQKYTIAELRTTGQEEEAKLAKQRAKVEEDEKKLKEEKDAQEKRAAKAEKSRDAQKAQMELEMKKQLDIQQHKRDEAHKKRMKDLEKSMNAKEDQMNKTMQSLEAEKKRLLDDLEQKKKQIEELTKKSEAMSDDLEDSKAAKTSYKKEKEELDVKLNEIKNEFGLDTKTADFYKGKFADIASSVEGISSQYFKDLPPDEDFEKIHEKLKDIDRCFNSIPIDNGETSENLRMAHVQRIISSALYHHIWQPFSSDKTLSHPEFANLLDQTCTRLARNNLGGKNGRAALVWRILAMRSLQSADEDLPPSPVSTSREVSQSSSRANQAVEDMLKKLSPLVDLAQRVQIQEALLRLAQSAADVWNFAQTDELKIMASLSLKSSDLDTWRSVRFDPVSAAEGAPVEQNIMSFTLPRVFTLFPQFIIQSWSATTEPSPHIPGSFSTPQQDFIVTETSIHPGIGLLESSALVIRGKSEEEERKARLKEIYDQFENQKKELARSGINRISTKSGSISGSRSGSISGSISGQLSPSARWAKGSTMPTNENED